MIARLGPSGLAIRLGGFLYTKSKSKNKEGRSTKYPEGTILANINIVVTREDGRKLGQQFIYQ
jgi:hypothetical protein